MSFPSLVDRTNGADVTEDLRAALRAGGTVFLPFGPMYVSGVITVPAGTHVVGNTTTIKAAVGAWDGLTPLLLVTGDDVTLDGLVLDCQGSLRTAPGDTVLTAVLVTSASRVVIRDSRFVDQGHTLGSPTTPYIWIVANDDTGTVFVDRGDGSILGTVGSSSDVLVDNCVFEAGNQNFAVRCETNFEAELAQADFVNHVENVVVRDCTFIGEFAWNAVEFAGGGTRKFTVRGCSFDGKSLTWVDADKGCYSGLITGNHGRNGGKPARYSAVLKDTSTATGANSLTASVPLVAHAYAGMKLVSSAGVSYTVTDNTTSVFTLAASGATPASGAYAVGPALWLTTRLSCINVHGSSATYHTRDVRVTDNLLEDVVTATWTDAYESFLAVQTADDVTFDGNVVRNLNDQLTQGAAFVNHGDTSGVVITGLEASGVANGILTNLNNIGCNGFRIHGNRIRAALTCLTLGSADGAGTQGGLDIRGNYLESADVAGTLAVNLTNVWLRPVLSGNYVKGGLTGITLQSATGVAIGNTVDGAGTGFDYHAGSTTFAVGNQSLNCGAVYTGSGTINGGFNG